MVGEVNVDAMLRRITAKQFRDWEIYSELEPFGELRDDYRAASIVQMIHNAVAKKPKPLKDFLLQFEAPDVSPRQTLEQQIQIARRWVMVANAGAKED